MNRFKKAEDKGTSRTVPRRKNPLIRGRLNAKSIWRKKPERAMEGRCRWSDLFVGEATRGGVEEERWGEFLEGW